MTRDITVFGAPRDALTEMFEDWAVSAPPPTDEQEIEFEEAFHTAIVQRVGRPPYGDEGRTKA